MLWGRQVRIAHAEIDDIRPRSARTRLHVVYLGKDIGGKTSDFVKVAFHGALSSQKEHGVTSLKSLETDPRQFER